MESKKSFVVGPRAGQDDLSSLNFESMSVSNPIITQKSTQQYVD